MKLRDQSLRVMKSSNIELEPTVCAFNSRSKYRYSISKLLRLRVSLPFVICDVSNLNRKADIACIFRLPEEALRNPTQFVCHSKALAEFAYQYETSHGDNKITAGSSNENESQISGLMDSKTHFYKPQTLWNLHRRESLDRSDEPYPPPNDITTQKTDNFQKFYRAVVSPTHVRVTAGGRIVPNIKPNESFGINSSSVKAQLDSAHIEPMPISSPTSWPHLQSVQQNFPVLIPTSVSTPYSLLQPGHTCTFSPLNSQIHSATTIDSDPSKGSRPLNLNVSAATENRETPFSQGIRLSHPSQFDQTKPFMLNGQLLYPLHSGLQTITSPLSFPFGIYDNSSSMQHNYSSAFQQQMPPSAPLENLTNSADFLNTSQVINDHNSATGLDVETSPSYTLAAGIKTPFSDSLNNQLRTLYSSLNNVEYQITCKNSQHDVGLLEAQRNSLESQINSTKNTLAKHSSGRNFFENFDLKNCLLQNQKNHMNTKDMVKQEKNGPALAENVEMERRELTTNTENFNKASQVKPLAKSRLSISSAKAPPFQPRSQTAANINPAEGKKAHFTPEINHFGYSSQPVKDQTSEILKIPTKIRDINSKSSTSISESFPRSSNTALEPSSLNSVHEFPRNNFLPYIMPAKNLGAPYLVGTISRGSQYNPTKPFDIVYSRPLTDEERHARYLYFGKAPRSAQSGLPKFDGKDFYPPSPSKSTARLSSSHSESHPTDSNMQSRNIIFNSSENSVPISRSPVRNCHSLQNVNSVSRTIPGHSDDEDGMNSRSNISQVRVEFQSHKKDKDSDESVQNNKITDIFAGKLEQIELKPSCLYEEISNFSSSKTQPEASVNLPVSNEDKNNLNESQRGSVQSFTFSEQNSRGNNFSSPDSGKFVCHSTDSTVEIQLSPRLKGLSSNLAEQILTERLESLRRTCLMLIHSANQSHFLQNMLRRNTVLLPPIGSALSGAVTSEHVRGYLPHYQGSAIASLFPVKPIPMISPLRALSKLILEF
ncbi:hypothetical protein GcM3_019011 [Golovinomyces cichoracearum]|uniref:Uncharacterized protein n=1 Tax=Golovinomyces cichoracearum TaxID=62708 RepID=A0A420J7X1_9PEZI|nr:hypothetical protein GcM3_019011 [Golovinomyces cichoracearum]